MAFHKEYGIELNNYSVPCEWWKDGTERIYDDNWQREGFIEVNREPIYGDMCMFQLQAPVTNHAGIYLGNNELLHHMSGKLSRKDIFPDGIRITLFALSGLVKIKLSGSLGRRFGVFHEMAVASWPECIRAMSSGLKDLRHSFKAKLDHKSGLVKIKLSGSLGRRFGVFHEMAVASWPECIRAMSSGLKDLRHSFKAKLDHKKYAIFCDGKNISVSDDESWKAAKEIRIIPVPAGSKSGGLFQIVLGAVIMVAAFYTGGASLAAMGALSSSAFMMGGAMVLGGVMQMISPQAGGAKMKAGSAENKPSYAFGGAVNTTAAGYPVPLPYGDRTVGGAIFSAGSYAEDKI
uniref:Tail assembly protein n=1 Tax=Vibrio phage Vc1 TaxID=1480731 RepID=A0A6M5CAZ2_9CAUD